MSLDASRRAPDRAALVSALSRLRRPAPTDPAAERCELCTTSLSDDHRHLLHLDERRIVCTCDTCWALRSGDAQYRPAGNRVVMLDDLDLPDELWARFNIPIGLAFFMRSGVAGRVIALYPSPAGATECELPLEAWDDLVASNRALQTLEPDAEGLVVNRLAAPPQHAIAPIDRCYALVGIIKASWEGISGGSSVTDAVAGFFTDLRRRAR